MTDQPSASAPRPKPAVLTTRDCADILGMSTGFIRGEIEDGRLQAGVYEPDDAAGRRVYRIDWADFLVYCEKHWKHVHRRLAS